MKVYKRGKGSVNLSQNDFVASGGEGSIYHVGSGTSDLAYKIFHQPSKVPPDAHIHELSLLDRPNIIRPIDTLLDEHNVRIGYTTAWVDGIPMCKLFVMGYRTREGIKDDHIVKLIENMKDTISYIHAHQVVIVDGNELNYIVGHDFVTPYFIDTTCWQTRSYPATVIMPSIRDWTNKAFNDMTDWFSFGVLACWLFTGAHPFKGKADKYDAKYSDNVERMKHRVIDGVSIFNPNVRVAPNVRLNAVPDEYKDWFIRMFEKGERILPPLAPGTVVFVPVAIRTITGTNNFSIKLLTSFDDPIIWHTKINGIWITKTTDHVIYEKRGKRRLDADPTTHVVFTEKGQIPILASIKNGNLVLYSPEADITDTLKAKATELMVVDNTLFYRSYDKLIEVEMKEINDKIFPAAKHAWNIMPNASRVFSGVILQNMLGKIHATLPSQNACITKAIPELDGLHIHDAKYQNRVLAVHAQKGNDYQTLIFRFTKDFARYDVRTIECDDLGDVNMTVLDQGIAIIIPKTGVLEAFGHNPFMGDIKHIEDPAIDTDMRLCKDGVSALFVRGNEVYSIKMK